MLSIEFDKLSVEQRERFDDSICSSHGGLVRSDEVEEYIDEEIFKSVHEIEGKKHKFQKLCGH